MRRLEKFGLWTAVAVVAFALSQGCSGNQNLRPPEDGGAGGEGGAVFQGSGGELGIGGNQEIGGAGGAGGMGGEFRIGGHSGSGGQPGSGGQGIGGQFEIGGQVGTGGITGAGGEPYVPCVQSASEAACDGNPICHSVFIDSQSCDCAGAGCCATFHHCADGGAQCWGGVSCALAPPFCDGPYVVAYANGCFEGCVKSTECTPVCTPGADQTCNDNPIVSASHGHCSDAGMCQCGTGYILNPNTGRCL